MIYTLTLNPCLDYTMRLATVTFNGVNIAQSSIVHAGGKGINVSIVLARLGLANTAMGFLGGKTGASILNEIQKEGVTPEFVIISEDSRMNFKITDDEGKTTEINGLGPDIADRELGELFRKLNEIQNGDFLVISGSVPPNVPSDIYAQILKYLSFKKIKVIVDARKELLKATLPYRPFLIKPNIHEVAELFDIELPEGASLPEEDLEECMEELLSMGAQNVIISMSGRGAIFMGQDHNVIRMSAPEGKVVSAVGAGDSLIAGFLAGYVETKDFSYSLRLGVVCGSATAFTSWLATSEDIEHLLSK